MIKKLFISKNDSELNDLQSFCSENAIALTAKSFLQFDPIPFTIDRQYDVVFFSSPRSVLFFYAQYSIASEALIACTGDKTKAVLESLGKTVAFAGTSSNPKEIAEAFIKWNGEKVVLFPMSNISKKSISNLLDTKQKIEVEAYTTKIINSTISNQDCYVFTSPSNVIGFFESDNDLNNSTTIAWGATTALELEKNEINPIVLEQPSITALITVLRKL